MGLTERVIELPVKEGKIVKTGGMYFIAHSQEKDDKDCEDCEMDKFVGCLGSACDSGIYFKKLEKYETLFLEKLRG